MPALGASLATSGAVGVASDLTSAPSGRARMLPVHPDLAGLFPWGALRRGGTVSVRGSTSLLLALLAEPTANDSWAAVVGLPDLGVVAAAELGVAVDRLAMVRHPGADLPAVIAALLDGMDLVVTTRARLTDAQARRLSARARHRGAVLLTPDPWPATDVELLCTDVTWSGVGEGHGHLSGREAAVRSQGRGAAARPARLTLQLPGPGGAIAPARPPVLPGSAVPPSPPVALVPALVSPPGTSPSVAVAPALTSSGAGSSPSVVGAPALASSPSGASPPVVGAPALTSSPPGASPPVVGAPALASSGAGSSPPVAVAPASPASGAEEAGGLLDGVPVPRGSAAIPAPTSSDPVVERV